MGIGVIFQRHFSMVSVRYKGEPIAGENGIVVGQRRGARGHDGVKPGWAVRGRKWW